MVEKLSKALEGLKSIQFTSAIEDAALRKKEKMLSCAVVADLLVSLRFTNAKNVTQLVGIVVENFIHLCDDKDSDVRMVADESLNRIIRAMTDSNMLKVQVELHEEIKRNGSARCLRAALWRFGLLSCYIRPNKGKGHVEKLVPCIVEICKRNEESVHETLATFIENTFKFIGVFIQDNDIKVLLKAFFHNLSSSNVVIRRTTAACINSTIKHCRKPHVFNSYVLNTLLDKLVPVREENSPYLVLGVLGCLRVILPNLCSNRGDEGISGSFGLRHKKDESLISVDRLIQTYELCLYYSKSEDNNIVTASLETLNQLLQNPPQQLQTLLLSHAGFSRSYIHSTKENKIGSRSGSEISILCPLSSGDENLLHDDGDLPTFTMHGSLVNPNIAASKLPLSLSRNILDSTDDEIKMIESPFKDKLLDDILEDQLNIDVDSDADSWATSEINPSSLLIRVDTESDAASKDLSRTNSRDDLHSNADGESLGREMNVYVGSFTDQDVSLNFCARHLAASFLLEGKKSALVSDRIVRVSVKSLALSCISAIVKLHPTVLNMDLAKNNSSVYNQEMRDIILFADHPDPQIRGSVSILVSCYINAVLLLPKGFEEGALSSEHNYFDINGLLAIIFKGLKDESSTCSRQVLSGLNIFLKPILLSNHTEKLTSILCHLPLLGNSSYWLLKVKLVEVLSELPFVCLNDMTSLKSYQEEVLHRVFFPLLADEDSRVRTAAAEALVKVIPRLYYGKSTLIMFSNEFTAKIRNCLKYRTRPKFNNYSYPFSHISMNESDFDLNVENSLSRIVAKLTYLLMTDVTRCYTFGCLEALKLLSEEYPPTVYQNGWNCSKVKCCSEEDSSITSSLVTSILSLLLTSPYILDLSALNNATALLGNLFAGYAICNMKSNYQVSPSSPVTEQATYWNVLRSEQLSVLAERIFTHVMKVLNMYSHLLEEVPLSKAATTAATSANLLSISLASPIKKQERKMEKEDKSEERKTKSVSSYKQSPQYMKLYDLLKSAYNNYKVCLDSATSEKFLNLLESNINVLCILLDIGNVHDTGRCAEEILSYLRWTISLRSSTSVRCVIQLLKSLFGTNLGSNWEDKKTEESENFECTLFANIYQIPSEFLSNRIASYSISNTLEYENLTGSRHRIDRKVVVQNADKDCLATYVRLFEPIVVKSLQLYTITNDVTLQSNILQLLNQLIQLRVNYCWLDADEIFVGFVLRQFELIEHGQILGVERLLPQIFKFLVLLSYEKHHSKTIMSIPKILQLCDGLMASNQCTQTHCIPALVPIVEDVFLSRSLMTSPEQKELETQREVVLAMLLRLVEFHEVMNMLTLILNESRTLEEKEKWKRWSRQVMDVILPLASQDKLRTETFEGQQSFNKLMSSLSPNVLRPIDPLLKILFVEPSDYNCSQSLKRWLSRVTVITETILNVKEDVLLCRLEEISPNINLSTFFPPEDVPISDPFNVKASYPKFGASETFARFLLKIISVTGCKMLESASTSYHFQMQLSVFFLCVFQVLKSGTFHRVSASLQTLLTAEKETVSNICSMYVKIMNFAPVLSCQFTYFLALLNYFDVCYWTTILCQNSTLPSKLVRSCGVISLSDYLCEIMSDTETLRFLLSRNMREVILLSDEIPIKELITTIHRRAESSLLMEAIKSEADDTKDPRFVEKLLRILEIAHNSHAGFILSLLIKRFIISPHLALSRLASLLACRRAEFLLTLTPEEVHLHLNGKQFQELICFVNNEKLIKRHFRLIGLLNKLSAEVYNLEPVEVSPLRAIEAKHLKMLQLDENWYFAQVRERCGQENYSGQEIVRLLSKLNYDRILEIMSCPNFNSSIPRDCLMFLGVERRKNALYDPSETEESFIHHPLFRASMSFILKSICDVIEKLELIGNSENHSDGMFVREVAKDEILHSKMQKLAPSLTTLLNIIHLEKSEIGKEYVKPVMEFGLSCLETISWLITEEKKQCHMNQETVVSGLLCCNGVLRNRQVSNLLSEPCERNRLKSFIRNAYSLVKYLVPQIRLTNIIDQELGNKQYAYVELRMVEYLLTLVMREPHEFTLPSYLKQIIRDLAINTCRIPEISIHLLKVPENCDLQEVENVEGFISIFSTVNWTSRQQFEEMWVGLLGVLGFNNRNNYPVEEHILMVQASTAAVEGITALLKNTMINPATKKILHHGRDSTLIGNIDKAPLLANLDVMDNFGDFSYHYSDNIEIPKLTNRYHHGLLSVEYIWTAIKQIKNRIELYESHTENINDIGLDLTSCVHLLMELYNQWIFQSSPDIRLITSCLKSSIVISDLFTDIAQFQWLLDFCLRIENIVTAENVVILPLVILGSCKAVSVVLPDVGVCERLKRLMLHSRSIPNRIATIQGLLYLLQSPDVISAASHSQRHKPVSTVEEFNFVGNVLDTFLPIAIDMIHHFRYHNVPANEEYERCSWSLVFYLLQHYHPRLRENREEMMNFVLIELSKRACSESIIALLVRGIERLLLTSVIEENFKDQISKIALDMISQCSVNISRCGLQLLMVLSFLEKRAKDIRLLVTGREDPEKIMKDMEKVNVLFEKLKRSYPEEAEIVGDVIAYILMDFTASDVLTKVIQEFLSSHQPHLKILSGLLFKVFERAELSLLEDWVVFSLSSFIQGLPVSMSVWTLSCFFVSASKESWLRFMFPLVQSRLRMAESEDRELLCLSASHFYKQLKDEKQKKLFVETFQNAAKSDDIFSDLLACL